MWVERITTRHDLTSFHSASKPMDDWLARHALDNEAIDVSRTYILTNDGRNVIGYYSLSPISERQPNLPRVLRKETPQTVDQGGYLLARLAVALEHQGRGLARDLFVDAVVQVLAAAELAGGRFIAVDPIDDRARNIYAAWGFDPIPGDEAGRMFMGLAAVDAAFGLHDDESR